MLLTPKGGSHRDLLPDQTGLAISASGGALVQTEERTRNFTDSWRTNLLKQKKPNSNGIQCYDPRLNRDIIKHMGGEYEKHLKLEATSPTTKMISGTREVHESSDGINGNPLLLPTLEGHHVERSSVDLFRYPESRKAPHDTRRRIAKALTPPALSNGSPSKDKSIDVLDYVQTDVPKPLSPSAVAQKLRRYKIGLSPQQKVKNLVDDMRIGEENWKKIEQEGFHGGEEKKVKNEGTVQPSPFHEHDSFWNESDPGQAEQFDGGVGVSERVVGRDRSRPKISDGMYEEMKHVFPHLNRSQLDQLSNEDFLFLRQALTEQGFIAQPDLVGEGGSTGINFQNKGVAIDSSASGMHAAPSFTDSTLPGNISQTTGGATNAGNEAEAHDEGVQMAKNEENQDDGFIYEDESPEPDMPESEASPKQENHVGLKKIDEGLQIGVGFDDDSSQDEHYKRISQSYSNSSYENSIADFHSQHQRENHQAIGMDRHPSVTDRSTSKSDSSTLGDVYSPIADGKQMKRGANKLPPFKWTEAESRENLGYLRKSMRQPRCYNCSKAGELWCDHCQKIACYNCWGIEDHHNTWEASVVFAADQGRLEKIRTMRGAEVIDSRKRAMEKTMQRVLSPEARYSLLSGHNVDARKKALDSEEAAIYIYNPKAPSKGSVDSPIERRYSPKALLAGSDDSTSNERGPIIGVPPPDSGSDVDLFLTGLNALSYGSSQGMSDVEQAKSDHDNIQEGKDIDSRRNIARMTLSARVPSGADTVNEEEADDVSRPPQEEGQVDERSLQLTHGDSAIPDDDGTGADKISDEMSAVSSPIQRPITAMTDNIPDLEDGDSSLFDSYSMSRGSREEQPMISVVNADQLYYKNSMTPKIRFKTGDIQRRLNDNYIEFDDMNVIHFSPAKKDPARVSHLENIYKDRINITAERTKGYGRVAQKQHERALHISHRVKRQVHNVLAAKKKVLATTQLLNQDDTIKIGKKSGRLPLHVPNTSNPAEEAVEAFSVSPLNKKLIVPEVNADGTATRRPPDPKEMFFKEKARKAKASKRQFNSSARRADSISPAKLSHEGDNDGAVSEYGEDDDEEVVRMFDSLQYEMMPESRLNTGGSNAPRRVGKDSRELSSEAESSELSSKNSDVGSATEWGWNKMRGRSAKQGNFPSLPFRGPPYVFDMDTEEHENTVHRVYSPQEKNRTIDINKLTSSFW